MTRDVSRSNFTKYTQTPGVFQSQTLARNSVFWPTAPLRQCNSQWALSACSCGTSCRATSWPWNKAESAISHQAGIVHAVLNAGKGILVFPFFFCIDLLHSSHSIHIPLAFSVFPPPLLLVPFILSNRDPPSAFMCYISHYYFVLHFPVFLQLSRFGFPYKQHCVLSGTKGILYAMATQRNGFSLEFFQVCIYTCMCYVGKKTFFFFWGDTAHRSIHPR